MHGVKVLTGLRKPVLSLIVYLLAILPLTGCGSPPSSPGTSGEMLIYCGITMIKPIKELADIFERSHGCSIKIIKGGSGDLLKAIQLAQKGDLYLPGEASYMESCVADGLCRSFVHVGFNRAVMVVAKNNPKNVPADLTALTNRSFKVVIADPNTGSIGREAKTVLDRAGLFNEVIANGPIFTTDSKDIIIALRRSHADVGINWYATTQWPENSETVDAILIPEEYAPKTPLLLGILSYSAHPDLALEFMRFAVTPEGRKVFGKFGFEPEPSTQD